MKISADKRKSTVNVQGEFTADELEEEIRKLCILRSQMTPEVPHTAPSPNNPASLNQNILMEDLPAMTVAHRANGGFRFWLRNQGLGWCAYNVALPEAIGVYKFLHSKLGNLEPGPNLFGEQFGQPH
jgi:hypothetical protein